MIGNPVVRNVLRFEYTLLRAPLTVVDQHVFARYLAADSPVRVTLERGLDELDAVAAKLLEPDAGSAGRPLPEEEQEEAEELVEDLLQEEENERFAGELADDEMRRIQAELRAKHMVEERHEEADPERA